MSLASLGVVRRTLLIAALGGSFLLVGTASRAEAAVTMTKVGSTVTITGDAAADTLVIDVVGGALRHNQFGSAGFNTDGDFDTATGGDQAAAAGATTTLVIDLGAGANSLVLSDDLATGHAWTLGATSLVSPLATVNFNASVGGITVQGSDAVDTVAVLASAATNPFTIDGRGGADAVTIGSAAGTLAPVAGAVRLGGGASTDALTVNDSVGTANAAYAINQEPGRTTLTRDGIGAISWDGSVAAFALQGGVGKDVVSVIAPPATPTSLSFALGAGDDTVLPYGATNLGGGSFNGGPGTDTFDFSKQTAGVTANFAVGTPGAWGASAGVESIVGSGGDDTFVGTGVDESILGSDGADTIDGAGGNDIIGGGAGRDLLTGGAGDDSFPMVTGGGNDVVAGGAGTDTADWSTAQGDLAISLDGIANDGGAGDTANVQPDIERVLGGEGSDRLVGSANADTLLGGSGNDTLDGGAGNDMLNGQFGSDVMLGGAAADGADVIDGGDDYTYDTVTYDQRTTDIALSADGFANDGAKGEGDQLLRVEKLVGGSGNDTLLGSKGLSMVLWGGGGNDKVTGLDGNDKLDGGAGNDVLVGGLGADTIVGGAGTDKLLGSAANDTLDGGAGTDVLDGGAGNDTLRGGAGNDKLAGAAGNDKLDGGAGNDTLTGGAGKDTMLGGAGNDVLVAKDRTTDTIDGGVGKDKVKRDSYDKVKRVP